MPRISPSGTIRVRKNGAARRLPTPIEWKKTLDREIPVPSNLPADKMDEARSLTKSEVLRRCLSHRLRKQTRFELPNGLAVCDLCTKISVPEKLEHRAFWINLDGTGSMMHAFRGGFNPRAWRTNFRDRPLKSDELLAHYYQYAHAIWCWKCKTFECNALPTPYSHNRRSLLTTPGADWQQVWQRVMGLLGFAASELVQDGEIKMPNMSAEDMDRLFDEFARKTDEWVAIRVLRDYRIPAAWSSPDPSVKNWAKSQERTWKSHPAWGLPPSAAVQEFELKSLEF